MEEGQKVHIGGIKFSEELAQVTIACRPLENPSIYQLLHLAAENNINITFLCHSAYTRTPESIFCVEQFEFGKIQQLLNFLSFQDERVNVIPSTGTLTLFPHRNDFLLLGRIVNFFGEHNFPVHSFCTSISAIALNTDFSLLDEIAERLQKIIILPENHAPFRQGFRVTQVQV